ncbi:MAG: amino acid-binding protein [Halobacteriales archaeon]|tara:strand:+ start:1407 stop:1943 length:537 start_codon:yes stop_codon:yes gene_type:complete
MGNKFRNGPRAYVVRLELADRPGELLRVLEPIASSGGNLLSIFHERGDITPRGKIPVEIDLECSQEQFESILSSYLDLDIQVTQSGEELYRGELVVLLIGDAIANDLSSVVASIDASGSVAVIESSVNRSIESPAEASSILRLAIKEGDQLQAVDSVKSIVSKYDLHFMTTTDHEVSQ